MIGQKYKTSDIHRAIAALVAYCRPDSSGEAPVAINRDLLSYALRILQIRSSGPPEDRRWHIADDWKMRLRDAGIDPTNLAVEDEEEFTASIAMLEWRKQERRKRRNERLKSRGALLPFGNAAPAEPIGQPANGTNWKAAGEHLKNLTAQTRERLERERSGW